MPGNRAELCSAAIVIAVAALFLYFSFDIQQPMTGDPLGPRWLPIALSSTILVLGLAQAYAALRQAPDEEMELALGESRDAKPGMAVVIVASALTLIYASALMTLGYGLATALFAITLYYLYGRRTLPVALFSGVAMAACFYVLFVGGLQTSLPAGTIWGAL